MKMWKYFKNVILSCSIALLSLFTYLVFSLYFFIVYSFTHLIIILRIIMHLLITAIDYLFVVLDL